jgi:hypothetical protein
VGRDEQQERGVDLVTVHRCRLSFEEVPQVDGEHVDDPHARGRRDHRRECLLMRIVLVGGEQDELQHPGGFPGVEQVVEHPVQRLLAE